MGIETLFIISTITGQSRYRTCPYSRGGNIIITSPQQTFRKLVANFTYMLKFENEERGINFSQFHSFNMIKQLIWQLNLCNLKIFFTNEIFFYKKDFSSVTQSCLTLCNPMDCSTQASLFITNSRSPPKPASIESVMTPNLLILCRPLFPLPSIFSSIRVFSTESVLRITWLKN